MKKYITIIISLFYSSIFAQNTLSDAHRQMIVKQIKHEILDSLKNENTAEDTTILGKFKTEKQLGDPFEDIDMTWANGNDRRETNIWKNMKYFTPSLLIDMNYTHSFNNPNDNTVVGSTALARNNEIGLSALHFGGDFYYKGARARFMTQFGTRSIIIPRNDLSPYRGQYNIANAYRYLSEAYAGYHINKWYGINIDAGLFMSYIGLNSFYQAENWEYQASFTSDNTPGFLMEFACKFILQNI